MKKRFFAAVCVLFLLLTGCGSVKQEETQTSEEIQQETAQTESKEEFLTRQMEKMTTEQKVGQLLMTAFRSDAEGNDMTELTEEAAASIRDFSLGGVILFAENLDTEEQTKQLLADMQEAAEIPLIFGIDEEGGIVSRLEKSNIPHTSVETAESMQGDTQKAKDAGNTIGQSLAALGIQIDFAPVADINTNPENPVIGSRAFGSDAQTVSEMVTAFLEGLEQNGVSGTVKHFPGHGDTAADSHDGMVSVTHDMERLRKVELVPFQAAIDAGVELVMLGHIQTPNATGNDLPASLSPDMVRLLREEMGFEGILITDGMEMGAITTRYGTAEAAVMAVEAGADIVLLPADLAEAYQGILEAVQSGRISEQRLDESVYRLLSFKYDKGLLG